MIVASTADLWPVDQDRGAATAKKTSLTNNTPGKTNLSGLRYLPTTARLLAGTVFFVCGLNGFLNFLTPPSDPIPGPAMAFATALLQTGYMFPLIKGTEAVAGVLLLSNRFVPLALTILAPVVVNIVAFHTFLARAGLGMAVFVLVLEAYLAWAHRAAFAPMFTKRASASSR